MDSDIAAFATVGGVWVVEMVVDVSVPYHRLLPAPVDAESATMKPSSVELPAVQLPNVIAPLLVDTDGVAAVAALNPAPAIVCRP